MLLTKANESAERAWPATGRGDLSGQLTTFTPTLPPTLQPPPSSSFCTVPTIWPAATEFLLIYARKWRCLVIGFLLCFFPSFILVLFAASWQFNFAGVSTNIELAGKAKSLQSRLTDNLEWNTSAQFYINYAIEWDKKSKRILNMYPCVLAQQKRQT